MGYWWGVLGVIMVPQSDPPPKPLGVTVPHSSFIIWKWVQNLKPLLLRSSEALDVYLWAREVFGLDKDNHQKKLKFSQNRLNRLAGYENPMVLKYFWFFYIKKSRKHSKVHHPDFLLCNRFCRSWIYFWKILPLDGDFFFKLRMCVNMFTLSVLWLNVNWTFLEVLLLLWCNSSIVQLILLDKIPVLVNLAGILAFSDRENIHAKFLFLFLVG